MVLAPLTAILFLFSQGAASQDFTQSGGANLQGVSRSSILKDFRQDPLKSGRRNHKQEGGTIVGDGGDLTECRSGTYQGISLGGLHSVDRVVTIGLIPTPEIKYDHIDQIDNHVTDTIRRYISPSVALDYQQFLDQFQNKSEASSNSVVKRVFEGQKLPNIQDENLFAIVPELCQPPSEFLQVAIQIPQKPILRPHPQFNLNFEINERKTPIDYLKLLFPLKRHQEYTYKFNYISLFSVLATSPIDYSYALVHEFLREYLDDEDKIRILNRLIHSDLNGSQNPQPSPIWLSHQQYLTPFEVVHHYLDFYNFFKEVDHIEKILNPLTEKYAHSLLTIEDFTPEVLRQFEIYFQAGVEPNFGLNFARFPFARSKTFQYVFPLPSTEIETPGDLNAASLSKPKGHGSEEFFIPKSIIDLVTRDAKKLDGDQTTPATYNSPMFFAAKNGHLDLVKLMIKYGANPRLQVLDQNEDLNIAKIAIQNGHTKLYDYLIESWPELAAESKDSK